MAKDRGSRSNNLATNKGRSARHWHAYTRSGSFRAAQAKPKLLVTYHTIAFRPGIAAKIPVVNNS
jgi:hypothetical protein